MSPRQRTLYMTIFLLERPEPRPIVKSRVPLRDVTWDYYFGEEEDEEEIEEEDDEDLVDELEDVEEEEELEEGGWVPLRKKSRCAMTEEFLCDE